ncbi:arabinogalactan oligomer/maltooligosaccharide transport system substrate-binding protein [Paenibacillus forsythiae]|uniref:Arabinogalactan oligomer/maltooligosaccharide transport system substrate-binding protein n=1 Tax=Paenibacillus forsythiae TaxID=365616 RepID=A0ABU3H2F0_9BACL|nr:extracellular solute-binding protein [Paenibacillus forsythiae]MDT3424651.1 arabinogalactan oligomer/maltooligosaccharide transport system substrate-binding protein [Paenibacillus forsythiae]
MKKISVVKKISVWIILGLTFTVLFSACSGESRKEPVTLTLMNDSLEQESEFIKARIGDFEQAHPNIKVNIMDVNPDAALNVFKNALLGDQPLDAMRMDYLWVPEFADLGLLYPLNDMLPESDRKDFNPATLRSVQYSGKIYGLPSVMDAPALLYNKRILRENGFSAPPQTMDELLEIARKVTNKDHYGIYLMDASYFSLPYIWAFGGGTITDDRKIEITSKDSIEGLKFMRKLKQEHAAQPYSGFEDAYNKMNTDFKEGRSAMMINGPWALSDLLSGGEFKDAGNLGITTIPKGPKGQASPAGGHGFTISKYSKHPKETYELISYLSSTETQIQQAKEVKTLPTRTSAYQDAALAADPVFQGFKQQLDAARSRPLIPESSAMFYDFTSNLREILLGTQSAEEGARKIEASWRTLLKLDR